MDYITQQVYKILSAICPIGKVTVENRLVSAEILTSDKTLQQQVVTAINTLDWATLEAGLSPTTLVTKITTQQQKMTQDQFNAYIVSILVSIMKELQMDLTTPTVTAPVVTPPTISLT